MARARDPVRHPRPDAARYVERVPTMAVIYHPGKVKLDALRRSVARAEGHAGWGPSRWYETTAEDPGQGQAQLAIEAGADTVAAAGGDGTVRAVAETLRGTDVPLALLPQGTGNLLARNLSLPLSGGGALDAALRIAFGGQERRIDVGVATVTRADGAVEDHAFLVIAGMGLDAAMIQHTQPQLKRAVGWVAYFDGIARAIPGAKPFRVDYRLDGEPSRSVVAHSVVAANCGVVGPGLTMAPDAKLDDGLLDIAAIKPRSALGWIRIWNTVVIDNGILRRTSWGSRLADWRSQVVRDVVYQQAASATLTVTEPVPFEADGDELGEIIGARAWIAPQSLRVKAPAP